MNLDPPFYLYIFQNATVLVVLSITIILGIYFLDKYFNT
jgi:hypothetical protein